MEAKILIADDEEQIRELLSMYLERFNYQIDTAANASEALALMDDVTYDIILTDKNMPDADGNIEGGMEILRYVNETKPDTEAIMITGYATVETAVEAMKLGAIDYIMKPIPLEELKAKIDRVLEYQKFINSEHTLKLYRNLQGQVLDILGRQDDIPEEEMHKKLRTLGSRIDQIFGLQKEYEKIIQSQSDALKNIESMVAYLSEAIPSDSPYFDVIDKIKSETEKRIYE
ncbi:MAG: response regulator [Desulfobacteraceae bacterium]|nr:response regulator [Desulfobacteraceae bacterium]